MVAEFLGFHNNSDYNESQLEQALIDNLEKFIMNDDQKKIFCEHAMIPEGVSLEVQFFGDSYERRKELLRTKIRELLN